VVEARDQKKRLDDVSHRAAGRLHGASRSIERPDDLILDTRRVFLAGASGKEHDVADGDTSCRFRKPSDLPIHVRSFGYTSGAACFSSNTANGGPPRSG